MHSVLIFACFQCKFGFTKGDSKTNGFQLARASPTWQLGWCLVACSNSSLINRMPFLEIMRLEQSSLCFSKHLIDRWYRDITTRSYKIPSVSAARRMIWFLVFHPICIIPILTTTTLNIRRGTITKMLIIQQLNRIFIKRNILNTLWIQVSLIYDYFTMI